MGRPPTLKNKARSLARRQTAMQLLTEGKPITAIAEQLGITVRAVRYHLTAALETESFYPNNLTPERIAELRQLEGEKLTYIWGKLHESFEKSTSKDAIVRARLAEASTRISERLAKLLGLDQPTKIVEESMRLLVSKTEHKVTVSFDRNQIKPDWSIDTGFRRVPPDEDLSGPPKLLDGTNGNGG
jgi:predicted transcriptional regulator